MGSITRIIVDGSVVISVIVVWAIVVVWLYDTFSGRKV